MALVEVWRLSAGDRMSKVGREAVNRALATDPDLAYVVRKIREMGQPQPIRIDDQPPPEPIRIDPIPEPISIRPDPKPLDQTDKILAEILRMWPLLSERDKLELQGICQLKVYLNTKK